MDNAHFVLSLRPLLKEDIYELSHRISSAINNPHSKDKWKQKQYYKIYIYSKNRFQKTILDPNLEAEHFKRNENCRPQYFAVRVHVCAHVCTCVHMCAYARFLIVEDILNIGDAAEFVRCY